MAIVIHLEGAPSERLAILCPAQWRLPEQIAALEAWLVENRGVVAPGRYVADIGFTVRKRAEGGGAVMTSSMMRAMADIGMSVVFSEFYLE